jgi:hypothetical protein
MWLQRVLAALWNSVLVELGGIFLSFSPLLFLQ